MSGVTILVISCQKKKSGSYSPLLPSLLARTDRRTQTHTHALSPVAPPLSFLPHCTHTHTHVRTQASRHSACFIIHLPTQHSVPETDSIDAKLPVPAGSEPLKTLEAPYRIRLICHRDRLKCGSRVSQAVMTGNDY